MYSKESNITKLDKLHLEHYMKSGSLLLPSFYSKRFIEAVHAECDELLHSKYAHPDNIRSRYQYNSGSIPERFDPVVDIAPILKAIAQDSNLLNVVADCIGGEPLLFKDKLILKGPGTGGYPMHQDYAWWSHLCSDPESLISVAIAFDEATAENGSVEVCSIPTEGLIATARNMNLVEQAKIKKDSAPEIMLMKPGDVFLLHPLAPHQSANNDSKSFRRIFYLTYSAASYGDLRTSYYKYYIERERLDRKYNDQRYFW